MPVLTLSGRLLQWHQRATDFFVGVVRTVFWPKAELTMRVWLAKIFVGPALVRLAAWQSVISLPLAVHPSGMLTAMTDSHLGVSIELVAGALLALGAFTRLAALALLCLSLALHLTQQAADVQLFWMALFAWYAVSGPGPLSLDHLFARGLNSSALPGVNGILRLDGFVTTYGKPLLLSLLRVWIAAALLSTTTVVGRTMLDRLPTLDRWLPTSAATILPMWLGALAGMLLLAGWGSRYVAATVGIVLFMGSMMAGNMLESAYLFMLFGIFFIDGSGWVSLDVMLSGCIRRRFDRRFDQDLHADPSAPRVVIVGAGFGGISCAQGLRNTRVAVTLIDRTNYHLFQPLLYQVATAALSPGDIAAPIRPLFRDARSVRCLLGSVTGIDTATRHVMVDAKAVPYDYLVLATGATHSYFGNERWAAIAPGLKSIEDALQIRRRVLTAFELAEGAGTEDDRRELLTFLIVGGGPTGVELAGAIAELARYGMSREYRTFDPATARVILVQSGPVVLPSFPASLSTVALASLHSLGVEVMLGSRVEDVDARRARVNGVDIPTRTVLWAAGVTASPAASWLGAPMDPAGRVKVAADLTVPGLPDTFAIGDTASSTAWQGRPVPGLAPAAKQGGAYVAEVITAAVESRAARPAFRYRHRGSLATIGRKAAVADFGFVRLWGAPAWWLWGLIHVGFLVGARNRAATLMNWFWAYLTFGGGARLTAIADAPRPPTTAHGGEPRPVAASRLIARG